MLQRRVNEAALVSVRNPGRTQATHKAIAIPLLTNRIPAGQSPATAYGGMKSESNISLMCGWRRNWKKLIVVNGEFILLAMTVCGTGEP